MLRIYELILIYPRNGYVLKNVNFFTSKQHSKNHLESLLQLKKVQGLWEKESQRAVL
jgi:hypothetical protein